MTDTLKTLAYSYVAEAPAPATGTGNFSVRSGEGGRFDDSSLDATEFDLIVCPAETGPLWTDGSSTSGNWERMRVTRAAGSDTITITARGVEGTVRAIQVGDLVFQPQHGHDITDPRTITQAFVPAYEKGNFATIPIGANAHRVDPHGTVWWGHNALVPDNVDTLNGYNDARNRMVPGGLFASQADRLWSNNISLAFLANPVQLIARRAGPDPPNARAICAHASIGDTSLVISNGFRFYDPNPDTWAHVYLESQHNRLTQKASSVRYYEIHDVSTPYDGGTVTVGTATISVSSIPRAFLRTKQNTRTKFNRDIIFTAVASGSSTLDGNSVSIEYRDPGAPSQSLSVSVSGSDIVVHLATNISSVITSTAQQICDLVNADVDASALVTAAPVGGVGTGVVVAQPKVYLFTFQAASVGVPMPMTILQGDLQPTKLGDTNQPQYYELKYTGLAWNAGTSKWDFTGVTYPYTPSASITVNAVLHQARLDRIPGLGEPYSITHAVSTTQGINYHLPGDGQSPPNAAVTNEAYGGYEGLCGYQSGAATLLHFPVLPWWNAYRDRDTITPGVSPGGNMGQQNCDMGFSMVEIPAQLGYDPPLSNQWALGSAFTLLTCSRGEQTQTLRLGVEDDGLLHLYTNGIVAALEEVRQPYATARAWTGGDPGAGIEVANTGTPASDYPANTRSYRIAAKDINGNFAFASGPATVGRESDAKHGDFLKDITILPRVTEDPAAVDLTWQPVYGAQSYRIYVSAGSNLVDCVGDTAAGSTSITVDDASGLPSSGSVFVPSIITTDPTDGFLFTYTGKSTNTLTGIPASGSGRIVDTIPDGTQMFGPTAQLGYFDQSPQNSNVGTQTFTDGGQAFTSTAKTDIGGVINGNQQRSFLNGERLILGYKNKDTTAGGVTLRYSGNGTTHEATLEGSLDVTGTISATGLGLNYQAQQNLGSPIALTSANTYTDILSASLTAGVWLVVGSVQCSDSTATAQVTGRISDGTNHFACSQTTVKVSGSVGFITLQAVIVLGSTTTIKMQAASSTTTSTVNAQTANNNAGTCATRLIPIQIA